MVDKDTAIFCNMIRNRSSENRRAMQCFPIPHEVLSPSISILRQELDSMVRVIYLLYIKDLAERSRLIRSTLHGERWQVRTKNDKLRTVTDREMVELAQQLDGWTRSVYSFGCAFIHLSDYHNHFIQNPFDRLTDTEKQDILKHMRYYHGGPRTNDPDLQELSRYIPRVFEKIASNLKLYVDQLERGDTKGM